MTQTRYRVGPGPTYGAGHRADELREGELVRITGFSFENPDEDGDVQVDTVDGRLSDYYIGTASLIPETEEADEVLATITVAALWEVAGILGVDEVEFRKLIALATLIDQGLE